MKKYIIVVETDDGFKKKLEANLNAQNLAHEYDIIPIGPNSYYSSEEMLKSCVDQVIWHIKNHDNLYGIFVDITIDDSKNDRLGIEIAKKLRELYPQIPLFNMTNKTKDDTQFDALSEATLEDVDGVFVKSFLEGKTFDAKRFRMIFSKAQIKRSHYAINPVDIVNNHNEIENLFDIGIITALQKPEFQAVKETITNFQAINKVNMNINDTAIYYSGVFNGNNKKLNIVACCIDKMGMTATTSLATRMIRNFRPKYLVLLGIAAGLKGNIGDILIGTEFWDYGSGKYVFDKESKKNLFKPYISQVPLEEGLRNQLIKYKEDTQFLNMIKQSYKNHNLFNSDLNVITGPFATGSAVIASDIFVEEIKQQHIKLIGFDMEAYGLVNAVNLLPEPRPKFIVIKSIADKADSEKNTIYQDFHQDYASFTSAQFFYNFAIREL